MRNERRLISDDKFDTVLKHFMQRCKKLAGKAPSSPF
jgi:hypothetical protein